MQPFVLFLPATKPIQASVLPVLQTFLAGMSQLTSTDEGTGVHKMDINRIIVRVKANGPQMANLQDGWIEYRFSFSKICGVRDEVAGGNGGWATLSISSASARVRPSAAMTPLSRVTTVIATSGS